MLWNLVGIAAGQICLEFELARTVLVVDDDPLVLEVTADMLKDLGCEVVAAASGTDLIERLLDNADIEILVTDLNMPGMGPRRNLVFWMTSRCRTFARIEVRRLI